MEKRDYYHPDLGQSLGLVIRVILISIPFYFFKKILETNNQLIDSFILLISYLFPALITIFIAIRKIKRFNNNEFSLKFNRISFAPAIVMIFMGISVFLIAEVVTELIPMPAETEALFQKIFQPNIFFFILAVIVAPLVEEILFRGIILEGLLKNYSPAKAIIWSSVFFGIAHSNPWQAISAILLGLLIGWAYWKSKSLIPGILLHVLNNSIGFTMLATNASFKLIDHTWILMILMSVSLIVLTTGYKMLNTRSKFGT